MLGVFSCCIRHGIPFLRYVCCDQPEPVETGFAESPFCVGLCDLGFKLGLLISHVGALGLCSGTVQANGGL